jgi:hypothetical protein
MSSLYIEINYARILGQSIERWKIKNDSPFHAQGRCPVCGDSAKNTALCRFHVRQHDNSVFVKCFNCDYSNNLIGFFKVYFPALYQELIFDKFKRQSNDAPVITTPTVKAIKTPCKKFSKFDLAYISELDKTHPAAVYVASRHIPDYPFQYAPKFFEFASEYNTELNETAKDEPRLIIPFFDKQGNIFAFQGRDLTGKSAQKYITIRINKKIPNIFGIDRCNFNKPVQIVEGPIDSLFLKNTLASVNASLVSTAEKLNSVLNINSINLIYDNEPRNKVICSMYEDAIKKGYNIVIWPKTCENIKDINEMCLAGLNPQKIIDKNTFTGLFAQMEFQKWKKI